MNSQPIPDIAGELTRRIGQISLDYQPSGRSHFRHVTGNLMQVLYLATGKSLNTKNAEERYHRAASRLDRYLRLVEENSEFAEKETREPEGFLGMPHVMPIEDYINIASARFAEA